jgi:pimeloyl-ACP methyl ester carboxylesterase
MTTHPRRSQVFRRFYLGALALFIILSALSGPPAHTTARQVTDQPVGIPNTQADLSEHDSPLDSRPLPDLGIHAEGGRAVAISPGSVLALEIALKQRRLAPSVGTAGEIITVNTTNEVIDGDTSSISGLKSNPGANSEISFPEALLAVNNSGPGNTIRFELAHNSVISLSQSVHLVVDNTTIDGDTDSNGQPDIVIKGPVFGVSLNIVSSGNSVKGLATAGINLSGIQAHSNEISHNYLGSDAYGLGTAFYETNGIQITNGAHHNSIKNNLIAGIVSENFVASGIFLSDSANYNRVEGNTFGIAQDGLTLRNAISIALVSQAHSNIIGGDRGATAECVDPCNLISGSGYGVWIGDTHTISNTVSGNYIGTDATGMYAQGNTYGIVLVDGASHTTVGGLRADVACTGPCNLLSGNTRTAVHIETSTTTANTVIGNYVGTAIDGQAAIGNGLTGITLLDAAHNTIGGDRPGRFCLGPCNLISGNGSSISQGYGIVIERTGSSGNQIAGNFIGVQADGKVALPNMKEGISLSAGAHDNHIGGTRPEAACAGPCNVISGNAGNGILIEGAGTDRNRIEGNFIGTDSLGALGVPNNHNGVWVRESASNNRIGAAWSPDSSGLCMGPCNSIRENKRSGILITGDTSRFNTIRANAISYNGFMEIDLGNNTAQDGVTLNATEVRSGPNQWLNTPMSLAADFDGTDTIISGVVNAANPGQITVDLFVSHDYHSSGTGRSSFYVGSTHPNSQGEIHFRLPGPLPILNGIVSATATDANGSTSEISTRTPVIFVPGVSGSILVNTLHDDEIWLGLGPGDLLMREELRTDWPQVRDIQATDVIRKIIPGLSFRKNDIYGTYLEKLVAEGYREYMVAGDPVLRTLEGCDYNGQKANVPSLFVFAYDWRLSNIVNAEKLKNYMGCVQRFYPGAKVNITAHSMGGVLSRRYILDYAPNHSVGRLITMGTPWLGANKIYHMLETGDFIDHVAAGLGVKRAAPTMPSGAQLTVFPDYGRLGGRFPLIESGWDYNRNGVDRERYDAGRETSAAFEEIYRTLDLIYPTYQVGSTARAFHTYAGQSNWKTDTSEVKYFHLVGLQSQPNTIGQVYLQRAAECQADEVLAIFCSWKPVVDHGQTYGDGTVPHLSATRKYLESARGDEAALDDFNAPGAQVIVFQSTAAEEDYLYEHVFLPNSPKVYSKVFELLVGSQPLPDSQGRAALNAPLELPQYRAHIRGIENLIVADAHGNSTAPILGDLIGEVPGVDTYTTGDSSMGVSLPTTAAFTLTFRTVDEVVGLDVTLGTRITTTEAIRYQDISLPQGVTATLSLTAEGFEALRYDANGDGVAETVISPTVQITGEGAQDQEGPEIRLATSGTATNLTVQLSAHDPSGITRILYALGNNATGQQFHVYTGPFKVDSTQIPHLTVIADDGLANRTLGEYTLSESENEPPLIYLPFITR